MEMFEVDEPTVDAPNGGAGGGGDVAGGPKETLFFRDGHTRIDFILAYQDADADEEDISDEERTKREEDRFRREHFQKNLTKQGLVLEKEDPENSLDRKTTFVKVSAPWHLLQKYAEILNLKMPIKKFTSISYGKSKKEDPSEEKEESFLERLTRPFNYNERLVPPEPNFFTAGFVMDREDRYIVKDRESFFTGAQRSMIVWQILLRTKFDPQEPDKMGIRRLLSMGVYKAAYPLHDGRYDVTPEHGPINERRILYLEWARFSKWYKKQPLWLIKRYFGDKIGLYFAWLGFYTMMLVPAALTGLCVFIYGIFSLYLWDSEINDDMCEDDRMGLTQMCPQCDSHCDFWELKKSCTLAKFTYMFDNTATVLFALLMSFWATMFLEIWKRRQAVIGWEWDLTTFDEDEQTRPEFETKVKTKRINPVTKKAEPFLPAWNKAARVAFTYSFVLFMLIIVLVAVVGVIVYRLAISTVMYSLAQSISPVVYSNAKLLISLSAAFLNLLIIGVLNKLYQRIALWLTNKEQPRTQTDFENSYTFKMFLFQCINYYSSLLYIAFFKGKFFTHPGDEGLRANIFAQFGNDVCDPAGCFYELMIQLMIIMVGKQIFNNFVEYLMPKIKVWWRRHVYRSAAVTAVRDTIDQVGEGDEEAEKRKKKEEKAKKENGGVSRPASANSQLAEDPLAARWERDYGLSDVERLALLDEYLEMVIQYGFITLFVAAFPLAPFFALLNNVLEIRLDAYKFIATKRRPLAQRAQDIGAWFGILQSLTYISVATNGITIALASDFVPHLVYRYGYSDDNSLKGYMNFSLTAFRTMDWGDVNDTNWPGPTERKDNLPDVCYFKGHRGEGPEYKMSEAWFHILAAKFAFVLVFEHFVFILTGLMAVLVPDIPTEVKVQIQRENMLAREILLEDADGTAKDSDLQEQQDGYLRHLERQEVANEYGATFEQSLYIEEDCSSVASS